MTRLRILWFGRWAILGAFFVAPGFVAPGLAQPIDFGQVKSLAVVLKDIDWEPSSQGTLLIIDPTGIHETPYWEPLAGGGATEVHSRPPKASNGRYSLKQWERYFQRRIVNVGTMSVFAPATMKTLNYRDLPPPDPYAGMDATKKLLLFASRLIPAQWRLLSGPNGIGLNDVSGKQRDFFAAMLPPAPVRVATFKNSAREGQREGDSFITLSPEQRLNIRLRASRKMLLSWDTQSGGTMQTGFNEQAPGSKTVEITSQGSYNAPTTLGKAFGTQVSEEMPSRLKPGDLDFDAPASDKPVSLTDAKTVGELISRAAAATGVEIHCDLRYADLPFYLRGDSARAGDLLKAVCWGVTGTFRRVGTAFVLTDDKAGLGTRQLAIAEWVVKSRALAEKRDRETQQALGKINPTQYISWEADDKEILTGNLNEKFETFVQKIAAEPLTDANRDKERDARAFRVPIAELPAWGKKKAKKLLAEFEEVQRHFPDENFPTLKTDHIRLNIRTEIRWLIPGGWEAGSYSEGSDLIRVARGEFSGSIPLREIPAEIAAAKEVRIPANLTSRALLVRPATKEEIEQAAIAAKNRGLNELWAEAAADEPELLEAAVAAGKANGLKTFAVVRVLRPGKSVSAPPDLNLLGETSARRGEPFPTWAAPEQGWRPDWNREAEAARRRRLGDYLRCDLPATREAVRPLLVGIAKIPGLSGLVLRDVQPPGYDISPRNWKKADGDSLFQYLGFNEEMRLTFLRRYGVDPVDLSPLIAGRLGGYFGPLGLEPFYFDNSLPFFPDFGPSSMYRGEKDAVEALLKTMDDPQGRFAGSAAPQGARDRWGLCAKFRRETAAAFLHQLSGELKAFAPGVPVRLLLGPDAPKDAAIRWSSPLDATKTPLLSGAEEELGEKEGGESAGKEMPLPDRLRRVSKPVALCLSYYPSHDTDRRRDFVRQSARQIGGAGALKLWDGIILDFSAIPVAEALPLLEVVKVQ